MHVQRVVGAVVGLILAMLGLLWFVQGTGLVRICPVLCVADCDCVEGRSLFWEVAGAAAFAIGVLLVWSSVRRGTR